MFLTHAVNFGIGSYFSKGPGSIFCESAGPLYVKYAIGKAGLKTDKVKLSEDINEYYVNIIENSFGLKPILGKLVWEIRTLLTKRRYETLLKVMKIFSENGRSWI